AGKRALAGNRSVRRQLRRPGLANGRLIVRFRVANRGFRVDPLHCSRASCRGYLVKDGFSFLPSPWNGIAAGVAIASVLVTFIAVSALFFIWLERKVSAWIQDRLGPTRTGGKFGWAQTIADGIKLLTKEDTIPAGADHFLFRLAPYLAFC